MKKSIHSLKVLLPWIAVVIAATSITQAKTITSDVAQNVAANFLRQSAGVQVKTISLAYTEISTSGEPLYFVYNMNAGGGFIIVVADDAAHPILGYSTEKQFVVPQTHTNIDYWMKKRKNEIIALKAAHIVATPDIAREWTGDFSATSNLTKRSERNDNPNNVASASVAPMVKTTWDQYPYYNALCPGAAGNNGTSANACVTGCVATAMAQVMKYWNYPVHGIGSSSYCDCKHDGFTDTWGTLSADYDTTTYDWTAMPLNVTSPNIAVATLMYDCGVSVDMDYDPNASGAFGISAEAGGGPCSQIALVQYFGYDSITIRGYQKTEGHYADTAWVNIVERDLSAGRPVIYEGNDSTQGGHCWVCDGYDVNNLLHMNWGWSGLDDGYFTVTNLYTTGTGPFNPVEEQDILVGIQPPAIVAGILSTPSAESFNIYPNPASSMFTIEGQSSKEKVHYSLYNIVGKELRAGDIATGNNQFTQNIQVSNLAKGMYFLRVSDNEHSSTTKIDIQ